METYSRAPFITYDAIDANGVRAEVRVVTGIGNIIDVEKSSKGKAVNVIFRVENTEYKLNGWTPNDDPVYEVVEKAREANEPIHFRIETRRKENVDRTLTISEIAPPRNSDEARKNTFKSLAAVKLLDDEEWTLSPKIKTRLEEDPVSSSSESPYDMSLEEFTGGKPANAAKRATTPSYNHNNFEAPPYALKNNDGSLNYGSLAIAVPITLYGYILDYERNNPENVENITEKQRILLTRTLLRANNELQLSVYDGKLEKPALTAGSHTRARAILFEVIRTFYPITMDILSSKESLLEWKNNLVSKGLGVWKWSISEVEKIVD